MSLCHNEELVAAQKAKLRNALDWLNAKTGLIYTTVVALRHNKVQIVAYTFKIDRGDKPSLYFVYDVWKMNIKRFCLY